MDRPIDRGKLAAVLLVLAALFFGFCAYRYLVGGATVANTRGSIVSLSPEEARRLGWIHFALSLTALGAAGFCWRKGEDLMGD